MKQTMLPQDWQQLSPLTQRFIITWKTKKGYLQGSPYLSIGEALELLTAVSGGFRNDDFLHGTFNNVLVIDELQVGWDGEELLDILVFKLSEIIKKRYFHIFTQTAN